MATPTSMPACVNVCSSATSGAGGLSTLLDAGNLLMSASSLTPQRHIDVAGENRDALGSVPEGAHDHASIR